MTEASSLSGVVGVVSAKFSAWVALAATGALPENVITPRKQFPARLPRIELPDKASGLLTILPPPGDAGASVPTETWPKGYFEKTAGAFANEPFERPPQLPFEKREEEQFNRRERKEHKENRHIGLPAALRLAQAGE